MPIKRLLMILLCGAFALGACAPVAGTGTSGGPVSAVASPQPPTVVPSATPADTVMPFPATTTVLLWHREGGIAGFCDDLRVEAGGSYSVVNCVTVTQTRVTGRLDGEQLAQLARWVNSFQSFAVSDGQRVVAPDAMTVKTSFTGAGTKRAGPDDRAAITAFAALLVAQPASDDGGSDLQAVSKARQYLAQALNLGADQISVVSFGFVQWPDRCLGVVVLGEMCAQGVTPGYRVILQARGQLYELHTDESGASIRQVP